MFAGGGWDTDILDCIGQCGHLRFSLCLEPCSLDSEPPSERVRILLCVFFECFLFLEFFAPSLTIGAKTQSELGARRTAGHYADAVRRSAGESCSWNDKGRSKERPV